MIKYGLRHKATGKLLNFSSFTAEDGSPHWHGTPLNYPKSDGLWLCSSKRRANEARQTNEGFTHATFEHEYKPDELEVVTIRMTYE